MRKTLSILLILFFTCSAAAAQAVEYSESVPYQPREVKPEKPKKEKKRKDDSKKTNQSSNPDDDETKRAIENTAAVENKPLTIPVSVFDRDAKFVQGLKKSDFKIFVDDKEQEILSFETGDEPLNIVLMIDTSPSVKIEEIQGYAFAIVRQFRPQDKFLVVRFNHGTKILTELTDDRQKIDKAIRNLRDGHGTSLYDALSEIFRKQLNLIQGRKAVVLLTDGVDTTSIKARYETSLLEAEKADARIFPIYFSTLQDFSKNTARRVPFGLYFPNPIPPQTIAEMQAQYELGRLYLNDLVTLSGGRVVLAKTLSADEKPVFESIGDELRQQYRLTFQPSESKPNGTRAQIKVRVNRPNLTVLARGSFIAGAGL